MTRDDNIVFEETGRTIRHYSNLRWLIIPVFISMNAAIFLGYGSFASSDGPFAEHATSEMRPLLPIMGVFASVLFLLIDRSLDSYLTRFRKFANAHTPGGLWSVVPGFSARVLMPFVFTLFYLLWMAFWAAMTISELG